MNKESKILVTGVKGQLGFDVIRRLQERGYSNILGIDKDELELDDNEILDSDLIKFKVIDSKEIIGNVIDIFYASGSNKILRVMFDREVLIPFNSPMIEKIDKNEKVIYVNLIEGM